jgi:hypothetical protein
MKIVLRLFWTKSLRALNIVPVGLEAGIPLTLQSMDLLKKILPGLLLELHLRGPNIFVRL